MKVLNQDQVNEYYKEMGFTVSLENEWYRKELILAQEISEQQQRVGCKPPQNEFTIASFAQALIGWHANNNSRLLWVDHWNLDFPGLGELFIAARQGLDSSLSLTEAPGHLFGEMPYGELDSSKLSKEQQTEISILIGLTCLMFLTDWDGWIIANNSQDRLEFWEGNIYFHSTKKEQIKAAQYIIKQYKCEKI